VPTAIPPTPITGNEVFNGDLANGAGDWQLGTGWTVANGTLESGSGSTSLVAPYVPSSADYAIEADITIVSGAEPCPNGVGLFGRGTAGQQPTPGYSGIACQNEWAILASVRTGNTPDTLAQGTQHSDQAMHTYRLELQGNQQRLFIDSKFVGESTNSRWTVPGVAGIYLAGNDQIRVSGSRIYQLP
jgi:hypothetical protein